MLRHLRQPRYAALSVLMVLVALICIAAGSWQIARLVQKAGWNDELRRNAHAAVQPVAEILPVTGTDSRTPSTHAVQFHTVTATGTFDSTGTTLVRQVEVNGDTGYLVVTPLRTADADLLVVRGFISGTSSDAVPTPPPAPSGTVAVTARVEPAESRDDQAARLPAGEVESINPAEQSRRLGRPVFDGYGELLGGQPGTDSLVAIPPPDLSNPAGGAVEPQHLAYIIQWYLFAALAVAAPFAMVRAETRRDAGHDFDVAADRAAEASQRPRSDVPSTSDQRAAKLADRYGRAIR